MERSTPVRKPHTSTTDLLTWSENPPPASSLDSAARPAIRTHQVALFRSKLTILFHAFLHFPVTKGFSFCGKFRPSNGIGKVVFGGQVTDEEVESLLKRCIAVAVFLALGFAFYVFFAPFVGSRVIQYVVMGIYTPLRCILDIDVQGARSVKASSLEVISIFICPPSFEELEKRLRGRFWICSGYVLTKPSDVGLLLESS